MSPSLWGFIFSSYFVFACVVVMVPPSWTRTIDIRCTDFPAGTLSVDVAKWVFEYFDVDYKVVLIQQCPSRIARVTFADEEGDAKSFFEELGAVVLNGVMCTVISPPPPPPPLTNVVIYHFPFEGSNDAIEKELDAYGTVKDVRFQHWTNLPEVATGTWVVRMVLEFDIPHFIYIWGIRCKVWYKGQPVDCDVCRKNGHKASSCPDKGKCLRCHESGHFARNCPNPWGRNHASIPVGRRQESNQGSHHPILLC